MTVSAFIDLLNAIAIFHSFVIIWLSWLIYHRRARNPLLIISAGLGGFYVIVFTIILILRQTPQGAFPSSLVGVIIWGAFLFGQVVLVCLLTINMWAVHLWRGRID